MKPFALVVLAAALVTASVARAEGPPYATVERQVGSTRIIEHAPVSIPVVRAVRRSRVVVKRRRARAAAVVSSGVSQVVALSEKQEFYPNASIAGGCRDGGLVRRRDVLGQLVLRQREVCDSLAPLTGRRWSVAARSP